jgi:hypothetical protein
VWPYPTGISGDNVARQACQAMNLDLATLTSVSDKAAFWSLLGLFRLV